jgi:S1-C subfamily serine protease
VDEALADRITTTISDRVAENITEDVVNSATLAMQGIVEKQVIENFKREYNLPDNYAGIGVIAAAEVGSVLELTASASGSSSQSSAFILNKDGYVITNAHCVTYEYKIWQTPFLYTTETRVYSDIKANFKGSDTKYSMSVIAYDTNKDLAIIKFDNPPSNLKPIRFGDSALVTLGEEVAAIGNAQGLGTSLTTGVVSNPPQPYKNVKVIQTDTTINPGNSGGPLFNIYGQVIGVVSFKIIESQLNEGLGFAIAAESVISYINQVESQKGINIEYTLES